MSRKTASRSMEAARKPGRRITRRGRPSTGPKQPFSLILNPDELSILRKMADKEKTSVANIIRRALHTVIFHTHPELARASVEREVDSFLDSMGNRIPTGLSRNQSKRARLKKQLMAGILQGAR